MPRNDNNKSLQQVASATSNHIQQQQQQQQQQHFDQTTVDHQNRNSPPNSSHLNGIANGLNATNRASDFLSTNNQQLSSSSQQQQPRITASSKIRCYLCETPKHEFSLIRTFSEIVCRSCLNYEGPERVEQLILDARRDKICSRESLHETNQFNVCLAPAVQYQQRPSVRQSKNLAGRRQLPSATPSAAVNTAPASERPSAAAAPPSINNSLQHWQQQQQQSKLSAPIQAEAAVTFPPEHKKRRELPLPATLAQNSQLPARQQQPSPTIVAAAAVAQTQVVDKRSSPPRLGWRGNSQLGVEMPAQAPTNGNYAKPVQVPPHLPESHRVGGSSLPPPANNSNQILVGHLYADRSGQPLPIHHTSQSHIPYSHYQTVGSPILAASASSGQQEASGSILEAAIVGRTASTSLSGPTSPPNLNGIAGTGRRILTQPSSAPVVAGSQTQSSSHLQANTAQQPPPPPPPPPPSHLAYPLSLPMLLRNISSSSAAYDQYARDTAAYDYYLSQQRSHALAAQEAANHHHHQLYTSHQQQQQQQQQQQLDSAKSSSDMLGPARATGRPGLFARHIQSQSLSSSQLQQQLLVAATGIKQSTGNLYQTTGPPQYHPYLPHQLSAAELQHYSCLSSAGLQPIHSHQSTDHHHQHRSQMSSMLSNRPPPSYAQHQHLLTTTAPPQPPGSTLLDPKPSTESLNSTTSGSTGAAAAAADDETITSPASPYDFQSIEQNVLTRRLAQNEATLVRKHSLAASRTNQQEPEESSEVEDTEASQRAQTDCNNDLISPTPPPPPPPEQQMNHQKTISSTIHDSLPNTEATLRILLNTPETPTSAPLSSSGSSRQSIGSRTTTKEMEASMLSVRGGSWAKRSSLDEDHTPSVGSKYESGSGGSILTHNHNPNKAFKLGPAPHPKRQYSLEEISPPAHKPPYKTTNHHQHHKSRNLTQQTKPILIDEDELDMDDTNAPVSMSQQPFLATTTVRLSHAENKPDRTPDSMVGSPSGPEVNSHHRSGVNRNYSLRSQSSSGGGGINGCQVSHTAGIDSPPPTGGETSSSSTGGDSISVSGATNGFCGGRGNSSLEQQQKHGSINGRPNKHNSNNNSGSSATNKQPTTAQQRPTSGPANQHHGSYEQLKCLLCNERLEDRHFVQCPTNQLHKFCFACSKISIQRQRNENLELKTNEDKIFCPSGKKCLLASERSPWTFMNNEIETIFRESTRAPPPPTAPPDTTASNKLRSDKHTLSNASVMDYLDQGDELSKIGPSSGSGKGIQNSTLLDATSGSSGGNNKSKEANNSSINDKNTGHTDSRHTKQQLINGTGTNHQSSELSGGKRVTPISDSTNK